MKNIIFLGMRGSGKSTIGKMVAEKLQRNFFDTDTEIEKKIEISISAFVKKNGWEKFREEEKNICAEISQEKNAVIATGGGVVLDEKNTENLKKNGILFFLEVPTKVLAKRIEAHNADHRPTFTEKSLQEELNEVWENRKEKYFSAADFVVDGTRNFEEIMEEILNEFK